MTVPDRQRWRLIEPWLDQALDLPPTQRANWLAALSTTSPEIAAELESYLADDEAAEARGFLSAPMELSLAGTVIGAYTLERPLGHGGMGSVWLARRSDGRFEGRAAVKLLNLSLLSTAGQERFRQEGSVLARLEHAGIARLLDAGVSGSGQPYLVIEYVNGQRIDDYVRENGLEAPDCVRLFLNVLDAVGHAHSSLIVHRDLKPSNILVRRDGEVKLLDFGIAKLLDGDAGVPRTPTMEDVRALTPEYAAPEQIRGESITTATDVFALGVLLYVLLSGRHPSLDGYHTPAQALQALLRDVTPVPLGLGDLDFVVRRALKQAPTERYQTVRAFADDLQRWLRHQPVTAGPDSLPYRVRKLVRRHRTVTLVTTAGVVLGAAWLGMIVADRARVRRALADATASAHTAEQVTEFAIGMFDSRDGSTTADSLKARDLLARGVARAHELAGQPATEAQMLDLIGRIRMEIGDYKGARPVLQEALAIRERTLGPMHPDVATSLLHNAALLTAGDRDDSAALPLLRRALVIRQHLFGAADPRTTDALWELASTLHIAGGFAEARPRFVEWRQLVARQPVQLTPQRAEQLGTMADILEYSGELRSADTLRRQVLALDRGLHGPSHYLVARDLSQLGSLQLDLGDTLAADTLLHQAVALVRLSYPAGHPQLAHSLRNLGYLLVDRARWTEADSVWRQSAAAYGSLNGRESMGYVNAMSYLAFVTVMRGNAVEGERQLRAILATPLARRAGPNPIADRARMFLGKALLDQGRVTEAEPLLLAAFTRSREGGMTRETHRFAAKSLADLYEAEGRPDAAASYRVASRR